MDRDLRIKVDFLAGWDQRVHAGKAGFTGHPAEEHQSGFGRLWSG